jgi:hypothetical protein
MSDDAKPSRWSAPLQHISTLALIAGGVFALWRYYDTTARQFQRPLWEQQVKHYFETTRATAQLASLEPGPEWQAAANEFWVMYFGPLSIVEDQSVEQAMVDFSTALEAAAPLAQMLAASELQSLAPDQTSDLAKRFDAAQAELQSASLSLAWACRDSLNSNLDAGLPALKYRKQLDTDQGGEREGD